jgi:hypothetical protein
MAELARSAGTLLNLATYSCSNVCSVFAVHSEANARRIACVESAFGSSGQTLAVPGRVLVGEGVLTKLCRKRPKPRQFFLFSDILVYGNIVMNKKKYNKQHILPLEDVQLQSLEDDGPLRHGWQIISPKKSFAVFAATATEKSEWMAHIRKCVNDLLAKSMSSRYAYFTGMVYHLVLCT